MDKADSSKLITVLTNLVKTETEKNKALDKIYTILDKINNNLVDVKGKLGTSAIK